MAKMTIVISISIVSHRVIQNKPPFKISIFVLVIMLREFGQSTFYGRSTNP